MDPSGPVLAADTSVCQLMPGAGTSPLGGPVGPPASSRAHQLRRPAAGLPMRRAQNSQPHDDDAHDRLSPWVVNGCEGRYMAHRTWQVVTGKQLLPLAAFLP
jgi:hypothetical protein